MRGRKNVEPLKKTSMEKKISGASLAQSKKNAHLCSALHISSEAEMSANNELRAFFMPKVYRIGSVPCGALMRPLPHSRCNATGSGTFPVSQSGTFKSVMIMSKSNGTFAPEINVASKTKSHLYEWLARENQLVSSLVEERVANLQVLRMVHAFVACTSMVVCASFSLAATVLSLLWFGLSLYFCKKGGTL